MSRLLLDKQPDQALHRTSLRRQHIGWLIVSYALLLLGALICLLPFFWLISSSLKPAYEIFEVPPRLFPRTLRFENYVEALTVQPFGRYFLNTLVIVIGTLVGHLLSCSVVAYGFARLRGPGRSLLFFVLLSTLMLPFPVTMVPVYIIFRTLGWVNTPLPLIVPAFFGNALYIFLMRQFFLSIPNDLEEAARMDGARSWDIIWRIYVPLSLPALATVAIFTFQGSWNDFLAPTIYLQTPDTFTLALGLNAFRQAYKVDWNLLMAASALISLPPLLVFFVAQKLFIEGIALTGLKG